MRKESVGWRGREKMIFLVSRSISKYLPLPPHGHLVIKDLVQKNLCFWG